MGLTSVRGGGSVTEPVTRIYLPGRSANPRRATWRITTGQLIRCAELSRTGTSKVSWRVSLRIYQEGSTLFFTGCVRRTTRLSDGRPPNREASTVVDCCDERDEETGERSPCWFVERITQMR